MVLIVLILLMALMVLMVVVASFAFPCPACVRASRPSYLLAEMDGQRCPIRPPAAIEREPLTRRHYKSLPLPGCLWFDLALRAAAVATYQVPWYQICTAAVHLVIENCCNNTGLLLTALRTVYAAPGA